MIDEKTIIHNCIFGRELLDQFFVKYKNQKISKPRGLPTTTSDDCDQEEDFDDFPGIYDVLSERENKKPNSAKNTILYNSADSNCLLRPNKLRELLLENKGNLGGAKINTEYIYATHLPYLVENASQPLSICFQGGFVFPVTQRIVTKKDDIILNVLDFQSLYPTMMKRYDICMSNAAYHPDFMIRTPSGILVHPNDSSQVDTYAVPVKISGSMLNVVCFLIKGQSSIIRHVTQKFNDMRKAAKKLIASGTLSNPERVRYSALQLTYKLIVNSMYGLYNSQRHKTFRPILGALVTYMGRLSLTRLVFESALFFEKHGLDHTTRGVIYGDTDSIFLLSTEQEANGIIEQFHARPCNANEVVVEPEKRVTDGLFFTKKHYILRTPELEYYTSKVFTLRISAISNRFLYLLFNIIFDTPYDIDESVKFLFDDFISNDDEVFKKRIKFSKLPSEYTNKTFLLDQYQHALAMGLLPPPLAGTTLECAHYLFCFCEGKHYGEIEAGSERMNYFLHPENLRHTILIDALLPLFPHLKMSKCMLFVRDLKTEICKIFNTIREHPIYLPLKRSLSAAFSAAFSVGDLIFDTTPATGYLDAEALDDLCNSLIAKKKRKIGQ